MRSILSMIWQYKGINLVFILFITISLFIMNFLHKNLVNRRNKYYFALTHFIIALIFLFFGFRIILTQAGVWLLLYSAVLFSSSVITLLYAIYLEIRDENREDEEDEAKGNKRFYAYKKNINMPKDNKRDKKSPRLRKSPILGKNPKDRRKIVGKSK